MGDFSIRMVRKQDIPALVEIYRPYVEETGISFEYTTPTIEEFAQRVESYTQMYPYLVAEKDGQVIGYAYGSRYGQREGYNWCAELSVYLSPVAMGMGVGKKLYETAIAMLEKQGVYRLYAIISHPNQLSIVFHEKMGFVEHGRFPNCGYKQGAWRDLVHMERELKKAKGSPEKVVPVAQLAPGFVDNLLQQVNRGEK